MLIGYFAYLVFQLWTHREFFEAQEVINFLKQPKKKNLIWHFNK